MNVQGLNPLISAPVLGQSANGVRAAATSSTNSSSSSSSSSNGTSATDLQTTFLNLLVTELQNQDPTQPVDPTEMVSQMVSLNQLDQLISINETLTNLTTPSTTPSAGGTQSQVAAAQNSSQASPVASSGAPASTINQIQAAYSNAVNNSGLMNLYSSFGLPGASTNLTYQGAR